MKGVDALNFLGFVFKFMENQLNAEQQILKQNLLNFVDTEINQNPDELFYFCLGAGGTGKTHVVCNTFKDFKKSIVYLGATNKVVTVLKNGLIQNNVKDIVCKTIDSFLGFKIVKDHENKNTITYRLPAIKALPEIIVIDEISMITFDKFCQIEKLAKHCKVILLGDQMQLPPIEEEKTNVFRNSEGFLISKIFTQINQNNSFTLTIQNRQKDGTDLSKMINGFRQFMTSKIDPKNLANKKQNQTDILFYKTNDKSLKGFVKQNDCVAVCHKNLSVLALNWLIGSTKSMRKDYRLNEINVGDKLMFDQFYSYKEINYYTSNIVEVLKIIENCTEIFKIKSTIEKTIIFTEIQIKDVENKTEIIRYISGGLYGQNGGGVSGSVYGQRKTYLEHIAKGKNVNENKTFLKNLNSRFSDYQNSFAKLKRPYAITCHKAQGSTYENVIIPVYDYYSLNYKDANQLLYVAMSRAKSKIIFVDKESNFKDNNNRYSFSEYEKQSIASANNYQCNICNANLVEREFDIDHKIPISRGGKNYIENLQSLCKNCHKNKTANEKF